MVSLVSIIHHYIYTAEDVLKTDLPRKIFLTPCGILLTVSESLEWDNPAETLFCLRRKSSLPRYFYLGHREKGRSLFSTSLLLSLLSSSLYKHAYLLLLSLPAHNSYGLTSPFSLIFTRGTTPSHVTLLNSVTGALLLYPIRVAAALIHRQLLAVPSPHTMQITMQSMLQGT